MKIFLALITLAAMYRVQVAKYTTTPPYKGPEDPEESYKRLLETWYNPPRSLKKKITLTVAEFDVWTSLGKFVPTGKKIQSAGVSRFCQCKKPAYPGKRSLMTRVKRADSDDDNRVVRREWRKMTVPMKKSFIKHFNNLATKRQNETKSRLQLFADWHRASESPGAHNGPSFYPGTENISSG